MQRYQINNVTLYLQELENEEYSKSKVSRRKEIRSRTEINEMETRKMIEKKMKIRVSYFERNKIEKREGSYKQNYK